MEFDGASHNAPKQIDNDRKKDTLCKKFNFPLLRIDARHLDTRFGKTTLLAWIMEVRETERAFSEAQRNGQVPLGEPFDPIWIFSIEKREHPYWLSRDARLRWRSLADKGQLHDFCSSGAHWYDDHGRVYGIEYIRVSRTQGIHVATWMRLQDFPEMITLFDEILVVKVDEQLDLYIKEKRLLEPLSDIHAKMGQSKAKYQSGGSHSFSRGNAP